MLRPQTPQTPHACARTRTHTRTHTHTRTRTHAHTKEDNIKMQHFVRFHWMLILFSLLCSLSLSLSLSLHACVRACVRACWVMCGGFGACAVADVCMCACVCVQKLRRRACGDGCSVMCGPAFSRLARFCVYVCMCVCSRASRPSSLAFTAYFCVWWPKHQRPTKSPSHNP